MVLREGSVLLRRSYVEYFHFAVLQGEDDVAGPVDIEGVDERSKAHDFRAFRCLAPDAHRMIGTRRHKRRIRGAESESIDGCAMPAQVPERTLARRRADHDVTAGKARREAVAVARHR